MLVPYMQIDLACISYYISCATQYLILSRSIQFRIMHLNLDKKVFLVTGGTKGIGRSIVRAFLQENAIVHFCSRTSADVSAAGDSLAKEFPDSKAVGNVVDVTQKKELESWVEAVVKESGRIDGVVGNVSALAMEVSDNEAEKGMV